MKKAIILSFITVCLMFTLVGNAIGHETLLHGCARPYKGSYIIKLVADPSECAAGSEIPITWHRAIPSGGFIVDLYVNGSLGEDLPGKGLTPSTPFKTITFALQQSLYLRPTQEIETIINIAPGTYNENLIISGDNVEVKKDEALAGNVIIDGAGQDVITINGSKNIVLSDLTIQNGNEGIVGKGGAAFTVNNVTVLNNADEGIQVDENSTALLENCTVENSGDHGIGVFHSNVILNGNIVCNNNGSHGIAISYSSNAVISGAFITADYNNRGIFVFNSSSLLTFDSTITTNHNDRGIQVYNSSSLSSSASNITTNNNERGILLGNSSSLSSNASTITFENNSRWGLQLVGTSSVYTAPDTTMTIRNSDRGFQLHGSSYAEITGTLLVENSGNRGIFVTLNSTIEIGDPADVTVRSSMGNGYGIEIVDGSSVNANGGSMIVENNLSDGIRALRSSRLRTGTNFLAQISNNGGIGVWLNDGSTADCSNSTINGNQGGDVVLSFGSRASLYGGTIGTISCDGTVLISGDYVCPP